MDGVEGREEQMNKKGDVKDDKSRDRARRRRRRQGTRGEG